MTVRQVQENSPEITAAFLAVFRAAQAIEARRAETQGGSVHESAVGSADAPNPAPNPRGSTQEREG